MTFRGRTTFGFLIDRLSDLEIPWPSSLHEIRQLGPWAVEFRYGETIDDPLDRQQAIALVSEAIAWAEARLEEEPLGQTQPVRASDRDDGVVRVPQEGKRLRGSNEVNESQRGAVFSSLVPPTFPRDR
jgi:hypothetical protein